MDQTDQIRERVDIVGLISEYVPLKRAGRNFKAPCPFHGEKTPSFVVSPERQIWHCFGCNKGGDVFTFLMEYEHLEFPESLRILAKKAGVELVQQFSSANSSRKEKIFTLNRIAADFYHYILTQHQAGKKGLSYLLETRGLNEKLIKTFSLGFSPSGNTLSSYLLKKKGYTKEDIADAGLATIRNGKSMDFFSQRIMFPLFDHLDNIVGFSGRTFEEATNNAKYVNTRETLVYHKGKLFFGLHTAKQEIKKEEAVIIVEGEFDVIACFAEGVTNVVAIKGTALTEEQVHLIARYAKRVLLCLDQDKAGQEAIKRSIPALEKKGLATYIVVMPQGKDPDEALRQDKVGFKTAVKHPVHVYDYFFDKITKQYDKQTVDGKKNISDELLQLVSFIENEIVKEHYLRKLSAELAISYESITKQSEKIARKELIKMPILKEEVKKKDRFSMMEDYILSLIIQAEQPKRNVFLVKECLQTTAFKSEVHTKIFMALERYFQQHEVFDSKAFSTTLPAELLPTFDRCFLFLLPTFVDKQTQEKEVKKVTTEFRMMVLKQTLKQITEQMKTSEQNSDEVVLEALRESFATTAHTLRQVEKALSVK